MKLERVHIQNFKGVKDFEWNLLDRHGEPRSRALLVGDNGSGKTSVFQAIASTLANACAKPFVWTGFYPERVAAGREMSVELEVRFSDHELEAAKRVMAAKTGARQPVQNRAVVHGSPGFSVVDPPVSGFAFQALASARSGMPEGFRARDLPTVKWFDQARNVSWRENQSKTFEDGVADLREELTRWDNVHKAFLLKQREGGRDLLAELEANYARVFPGASFIGVMPRSTPHGTDFFEIKRNGTLYDIAEASSGEQAILPILAEFVREDIGNAIVLIDEIELHLHPPLAQTLYNLLPKIGPDCQFLVTTHSEAVSAIVPEEETERIGDRSCL